MLEYITTSIVVSICFTLLNIFSYHASLKKYIIKNTPAQVSIEVAASQSEFMVTLFLIYLVTCLIGGLFSLFITFIILFIEFLFFWAVIDSDFWYRSNSRYLKK